MSQMLWCSYCLELLDKQLIRFGPQNIEGVVEAATEQRKQTHNDCAGVRQSACEVKAAATLKFFLCPCCVSIQ